MGCKPEFDRQIGLFNRDKGMETVLRGASEEWVEEATVAIHQAARELDEFTSDDLWARGLSRPKNSKALGPVLLSVSRAGVITPTSSFRQTTQASRNGAPVRVWKSLVRVEQF